MKYVNFTPIIDISSIIWDINDFEKNTDKYYKLKSSLTTLFRLLDKQSLNFLLRKELLDEITGGFPVNSVSPEFRDLYGLVQSFFSKINSIQYPEANDDSVQSNPDLKRVFFTDSANAEIQHLITRIHNGDEIGKKYFTFDMLWEKGYDKLITSENTIGVEHDVIISDKVEEIKDCLKTFQLKFEHNIKHDRIRGYYKNGIELVSPLSCYDSRNNNISKPQAILEEAIKYDDFYFGFDYEHNVYVRFINTKDNIYHAHDVSDIRDVFPYNVAEIYDNEDDINIPKEVILEFKKRVLRGKGINEYGKWIGT